MSRVPRGGRRRGPREDDKYESSLGDGHDNYYGDRVTPSNPAASLRRKPQVDVTYDTTQEKGKSTLGGDQDDDWYWGRYRTGGGGAPLKDVNGNTVTNLRQVHR
jgi:hypothetical protein